MPVFLISFLVSLSAGVWIYNKMMKSTGGVTQNAVTVAAVSSLILFIFLFFTLGMFQ